MSRAHTDCMLACSWYKCNSHPPMSPDSHPFDRSHSETRELQNNTSCSFKKAENYKIIGFYAQTELGHGSNVRGLETTANWNSDDKTFAVHSPHLTVSKWWIGSLGRTANYAVVMAQLMIDGKSYGPHPFVVHIRDLKTRATGERTR